MIEPRRVLRPGPTAVTALAALLLLAGCAGAAGSPVAITPSPLPPETAPAPASSAPAPAGGALDPAIPTACLGLGDVDCARAREMAATVLAGTDGPVQYVQVGPFGCPAGAGCSTTLAARPEGDVTIEFPGGTGVTVHLRVAADGTFQADRGEAMGVAVEPSSAVGIAAGPQPYTLGHCGVYSGIDADGAWWDPVGPVDIESGDSVNATAGVLTLTDPTHATFVAPSGFSLQLERRDGAKLLPFCM